MVVNKLVWAPRIHGLFARYEIIDLISIIMFSDCYQMRTRTTIQHSYIISFFLLLVFFAPFFQCVLSPWAVHPWPTCQGSLLKTLESCPDSMARSQKRKDRRKTGLETKTHKNAPFLINCQENGRMVTVSGCHWGLVAEVRGRSSRGGAKFASCLNGCVFKLLFAKEI